MVAWEKLLTGFGLEFSVTYGGGSCLFNCIAEKIYLDGDEHPAVRKVIVDHICANWGAFSGDILAEYGLSDAASYRAFMMKPDTEGGTIELQAYTMISEDANFRLFFLNGRTTLIGGYKNQPVYNLTWQRLPGGGAHYSVVLEQAADRLQYLHKRIAEISHASNLVEPIVAKIEEHIEHERK